MGIDLTDGGIPALKAQVLDSEYMHLTLEHMAQREFTDKAGGTYAIPTAWFNAVLSFLWLRGYTVVKRDTSKDPTTVTDSLGKLIPMHRKAQV